MSTQRYRKVSYGQAGKASDGGDRINFSDVNIKSVQKEPLDFEGYINMTKENLEMGERPCVR
jgi:hypothetical protein